jgi:pyrroline-5-carboxylate reductase
LTKSNSSAIALEHTQHVASEKVMVSPEMTQETIAFIGGGQMACALIGGLIRAGWRAQHIMVVEPYVAQQLVLTERFGVEVLTQAKTCLSGADVVVWATKPQVMQEAASSIVPQLANPLHVSIAAGISLPDLERCFHSARVVRAMPNTPALVGSGVTGMLSPDSLSENDRQLARRILSVTGHVFWVESDASMDAVTAISGSGPAYVFQFLESYQAAAQSLGCTEAQARNLVLETVAGAVRLAQSEATAFADLRSRVTSKNGTTEAALQVLNECGFAAAICKAVSAAQQRAVAISKDMSKAIG